MVRGRPTLSTGCINFFLLLTPDIQVPPRNFNTGQQETKLEGPVDADEGFDDASSEGELDVLILTSAREDAWKGTDAIFNPSQCQLNY